MATPPNPPSSNSTKSNSAKADPAKAMADRKIVPSIKPAQDEVASYRRSGRSDAPKQSNFNGLLVFVIVLMAVMMGIGGYTLFQVQQKLEMSNELLAQGQENIQALDSRLAATGTDVSKTLVDLKGQVETNFSEIDKLWAIAYRQNKPDIQKNARAIEELKKEQSGKLKTMEAQLKTMATQYQATLKELQSNRADNEELVTQIAMLRGQVQDQSVAQEANMRTLNILSNRIKTTQEAIDAIDQHRKLINQKLIDLERLIKSNYSPPTGP